MIKKISRLIFAVGTFIGAMAINGSDKVFASEAEEEIVLDLAENFTGDKKFEIGTVYEKNEYSKTYELQCNGKEYGYVELEKKDDIWVPIDFAIEENVKAEACIEEDNKSSTVYSSAAAIFLDTKGDGMTYVSYGTLANRCRLSQKFIEDKTGKYACAVVALTEIAKQNYALKNNSYADTFNAIWEKTQTTVDKIKDGITYGSTLDSKLASGMKAYMTSVGFKCVTSISKNPKYTFFQNSIDAGQACTLSYRMLTRNGQCAHTVNVFGWYIYKDSNGKQHKYLALANGWDTSVHYLLYEEIDFVNTYGVSYKIYQ